MERDYSQGKCRGQKFLYAVAGPTSRDFSLVSEEFLGLLLFLTRATAGRYFPGYRAPPA